MERGEEACSQITNEEAGIELGGGFDCQFNGDEEICCNDKWCYANSSLSWGSYCAIGLVNGPVARRVDNFAGDFKNADNKYTLQYEACEETPYPNQIVCYDSETWCKRLFKGKDKPVM